MDLTALFYDVDEFVEKQMVKNNQILLNWRKRRREVDPRMSLSEILTIIIYYHSSGFKNFKAFYMFPGTQNKRGISRTSELYPLYRLDALLSHFLVCLSPIEKRTEYGNKFYRFHPFENLLQH